MVIGKFGTYLKFEVYLNPNKLENKRVKCLTFEDFNRRVSSRITKHARILKKEKVQFDGPSLSSMTFTVTFSSSMGVNPRKMIRKLESCIRFGKLGYFVVGTKKIGKHKYLITEMSEEWDCIIKNGKLVHANVNITMEEYL